MYPLLCTTLGVMKGGSGRNCLQELLQRFPSSCKGLSLRVSRVLGQYLGWDLDSCVCFELKQCFKREEGWEVSVTAAEMIVSVVLLDSVWILQLPRSTRGFLSCLHQSFVSGTLPVYWWWRRLVAGPAGVEVEGKAHIVPLALIKPNSRQHETTSFCFSVWCNWLFFVSYTLLWQEMFAGQGGMVWECLARRTVRGSSAWELLPSIPGRYKHTGLTSGWTNALVLHCVVLELCFHIFLCQRNSG